VTIMNHMRVRANLTGDQVRDVLAFLQAANTDPRERAPLEAAGAGAPTAGEPGELSSFTPSTDVAVIAEGERLLSQKACLGCHVIGSQGGQLGPSLNGVVQRKGVEFVWQKVADPTINNATSLMPNFGLSEEEIAAIIAFLNTLDGGDE
ncbi:MAG: c-type cytochrome, partial [Nitrospirales bacterium]